MDALSCQLQSEALLHIAGPDTQTFLQGQVTCDTRELTHSQAQPGAFCTPQGRVVCDFLLLQFGAEHCALRMRADIVENAAAVFGKYIIFSKAEIDAKRSDWQVFACWGNAAAQAVAEVFGATPKQRFECVSDEHFSVVQLDDSGSHFECFINARKAPELPSQLESATGKGSEEDWQATQVADGIARIESATVEEFVPQTLNYDLTGHISFTKGCYTGQEVIARLHYRGTPKRRTYVMSLPPTVVATAGDKVYSLASKKAVGDIINVANDAERLALVSATEDGLAAGLALENAQDSSLKRLDLPYSLNQN